MLPLALLSCLLAAVAAATPDYYTHCQNPDGTVNSACLQRDSMRTASKFSYRASIPSAPPSSKRSTIERSTRRSRSVITKRGLNSNGSTAMVPLTNQQDIQFTGNVAFGTPAQQIIVDFDTGSADLWVANQHSVGVSGTFDTSKSSTFKQSVTLFAVNYGGGSCGGLLASDVISVGGLTVPSQYFGSVSAVSPGFVGGPEAGILGLGFQAIATSGKMPLVQSLIAAGLLARDMFGFYFSRNNAIGSTVTLGGIDTDQFTGPITYTPVTSQTYWQVGVTSVNVNGAPASYAMGAAIDTGTTFIYVPRAVAAMIYANVPTASADNLDDAYANNQAAYYQYQCGTIPQISFLFGGSTRPFVIAPQDFSIGVSSSDVTQCIGAIIGQDISDAAGNPLAIIGDVFLRNWYSVFNFNGTSPSVGFAQSV